MARMFGMRANSAQSYNNFVVNDMGRKLMLRQIAIRADSFS